MLKSDRNVLQCSCHTPFYGAQCERTAVDQSEYQPYAEVADPDMEHMLKHVLSEVITPLMWSVWIGFPVTILLLVYLIAKGRGDQCQKNVQKKRNREPRSKDRNSFAPLVSGQSHAQNNLSETDISLAHGGFGNHHLDVPHNTRRYCLTSLSGSIQKRHHPLTKSHLQPIKPMDSETILVQHTPHCFQKPTCDQRGIFQRNFYEATTGDFAFPQSTEAPHVFAHVVTGGPVQANDFPATLQKTMDPAQVHASYMQAMCEPINSHVQ
ncbi:hypothetical protein P879_05143 [Paragonimus westermani]|uniref:EGF-like domain-containing protein n=1 Tax=Paragonimus westermani TaxID=34504 RepID=A0A8T0DBW7_9TREM|nr:hypothetical protein P879_05143 [Paragonimus westermani]